MNGGPPTPLASYAEPLAAWFEARARALPWRVDRTPYRTWVAEIMLQQTRAATVVPYFERWMARFPDVATLAAADEEDVLAAWEGLGYYRRARALHRAARTIAAAGGALPRDDAGWRALPGVGPYTAAAIRAFADGARRVAVDGNVRRVGARLLANPAPRDADLAEALAPLLPDARPERGTEALIELGATVCTPRAPACDACPLAPACRAYAAGDVEAYPAPRTRTAVPTRRRWASVHVGDDALWVVRRPPDGLLGGLWGLPQHEDAPSGRALPPIRHVYSHFVLDLVPVLRDAPPEGDGRWADAAARAALPFSGVDRTLVARLERERHLPPPDPTGAC
ncbi:MAG: A/G-specific adenine glycosylase [Trueperaceae bacterium]|nr:A/G-specific adenine glycosylase [Trueperaceae bacterium]